MACDKFADHLFRIARPSVTSALGGIAAVEKAAKAAGHDVKVPFTPGVGLAEEYFSMAATAVALMVASVLLQLI